MKELSLNILDVAKNSVTANAKNVYISLVTDSDGWLTLTIKDDGCGMDEQTVKSVIDPFYTTRKTRSVGLGIPLLKLACEQTGGSLSITSSTDENTHGTTLRAIFFKNHIDFTPLGDVTSTIVTLIQGHPDTDFLFCHTTEKGEVAIDTRDIRAVLEDVPLDTYEVICWIRSSIEEQYDEIK